MNSLMLYQLPPTPDDRTPTHNELPECRAHLILKLISFQAKNANIRMRKFCVYRFFATRHSSLHITIIDSRFSAAHAIKMEAQQAKVVLVTGGTGLVGSAIRDFVHSDRYPLNGETWIFHGSRDADLRYPLNCVRGDVWVRLLYISEINNRRRTCSNAIIRRT